MRIALDLGQTVGWAAGASGKPDYGSFKIAPPVGMDFGRALASAADQVAALVGNSAQVIRAHYSHIGADAALMRSIAELVAG